MSDVKEQGATRRVRPSDFGSPKWSDLPSDGGLPEPKYPRNPNRVPPGRRVPGITPKWSPIAPNPLTPGQGSPLAPRVNPDGTPNRTFGRKRVPHPSPEFDIPARFRRVPRLPLGPLNDLQKAAGIADMVDAFFHRLRLPKPNPANGWVKTYGPCGLGANTAFNTALGPPGADVGVCVSGTVNQYASQWPRFGQIQPPLATDASWSLSFVNPANIVVVSPDWSFAFWGRHEVSYRRLGVNMGLPETLIENGVVFGVAAIGQPLDPNRARNMLSLAPPILEPGDFVLGVTAPALSPSGAASSMSDVATIAASIVAAVNEPWGNTETDSDAGGVAVGIDPDGIAPVVPADREPPGKNEKQTKRLTRSKLIMIATFKALDKVSEAAEVVDALYDALPPETKKKWKCSGGRGLIDTAGQYGIDAADCKAKALFHNWHKVDFGKAVENIIKNVAQDRIIGGMQRHLPRNLGSALESWTPEGDGDGGEFRVNQLTEEFLDWFLANI